MYTLLFRIPEGLEPLRQKFEAHVKRVGSSTIEKVAGANAEAVVSRIYLDLNDDLCLSDFGSWILRSRERTSMPCWKCTDGHNLLYRRHSGEKLVSLHRSTRLAASL